MNRHAIQLISRGAINKIGNIVISLHYSLN